MVALELCSKGGEGVHVDGMHEEALGWKGQQWPPWGSSCVVNSDPEDRLLTVLVSSGCQNEYHNQADLKQ